MSTADTLIALIDATSEALHRLADEERDADEFSLTFLTLRDLRHGVSELGRLEVELAEVRAELAKTRAQRDATQRALDKANRDNDELRRQVTLLKTSGGKRPATTSPNPNRLFLGGEGYYYWIE